MWKLLHNKRRTRDDQGFSIANVLVAMVILGVLGTVVGFTAFALIGQSRETVTAANIRTAAEAVRNTLALNPAAKGTVPVTGVPSETLMGELRNAAAFVWDDAWEMQDGDTPETVNIQMIVKSTGTALGGGATEAETDDSGTTAYDPDAPKVPWLVSSGDAVRLLIRNEDGAWACALIVMRPDWSGSAAAAVEGNLRGVWYDAGAGYTAADKQGLHFCSPTIAANHDFVTGTAANDDLYGNDEAGETASGTTTGHKMPLPVDGSKWNVPTTGTGATAIPARDYQRTVPTFG